MENRYINVFVTAPGRKEAQKIAASALQSKLAACASLIGGVKSSYWWKGRIENSSEYLIIMKTKKDLLAALIKSIKTEHSYAVPEIIALPIASGSREYLRWIGESVRK